MMCEDVNWIYLTQDRVHWRGEALAEKIVNLPVSTLCSSAIVTLPNKTRSSELVFVVISRSTITVFFLR
jgi:hypothetical protein